MSALIERLNKIDSPHDGKECVLRTRERPIGRSRIIGTKDTTETPRQLCSLLMDSKEPSRTLVFASFHDLLKECRLLRTPRLLFVLLALLFRMASADAEEPRHAIPDNARATMLWPTLVFTKDFNTIRLPIGLTYGRSANVWEYNSGDALHTYSTNKLIYLTYDNAGATNNGRRLWLTRENAQLNSEMPVRMRVPSALTNAIELNFWDGQSNSVGRRAWPPITTTPPFPAQVLMFNDRWQVAGPRSNYQYRSFKNPGISAVIPAFEAPGISPPFVPSDWGETGIVADMAERVHEGSHTVYVARSTGAGAEKISQIAPGSNSYNNMMAETAVLTAMTAINGGTTKVGSIGFVHGESDRTKNTSYADYIATENILANTATADIKAITRQSEDPVWYHAQLAASGIANGTGHPISQAQYDIALTRGIKNSKWRLCLPRYIFHYTSADGLHQNAADNVLMGEYLGHCRQWEVANATPWLPLFPTTIGFKPHDLSTISTTWHVPVSPIVFDTVSPIQGPAYNHGLQFVDDCTLANPSEPYTAINGVTITRATAMDITLSKPYNPACTNPHLRSAYDGPGVAHQTILPTVAAHGSGGVNGTCRIAVSFDTSLAQAQATYNATIKGGRLASVDKINQPGLYPPQDALTTNPKNAVPVSGCNLTGATVNRLFITRGFKSLNMSAAWTDIADSTTTISRSGSVLKNWAVIFDLPVVMP